MRKYRHILEGPEDSAALGRPWSRRRWLETTLGGSLGLTLGSRLAAARSSEGESDPGPKVLIVGDSMIAGGFGLYLARSLAKEHGYSVHRHGKSSTGLARPDFFDWIKEAKRVVKEFTPDVSVVMFGGNDVQGLYMGKGEWIRWNEPGWADEYAKRVNAFCDVIAPDGQKIYWVGMPVMRPPKFHHRVQRVNTIFRAEMAIRRGATFVDTWDVLADPQGEYADRIVVNPPDAHDAPQARGKRVRVRAGDGIHLSVAGAHHLEAHVLQILLPDLAELSS